MGVQEDTVEEKPAEATEAALSTEAEPWGRMPPSGSFSLVWGLTAPSVSEGGACAVLSKRGCSGVFSVSVLDNSKGLLSVAGEKGLPVRLVIVLGDGAADFGCAG